MIAGLMSPKAVAWLSGKVAKTVGIVLVVAMLASTYVFTYFAGRHAVEQEVLEEKAELALKEAELVQRDAELRIKIAEDATGRREVLLNNNKKGLEQLNEAIKAAGPKPAECDLSDDELRLLNEIGAD